jgi:hypothetical protein
LTPASWSNRPVSGVVPPRESRDVSAPLVGERGEHGVERRSDDPIAAIVDGQSASSIHRLTLSSSKRVPTRFRENPPSQRGS